MMRTDERARALRPWLSWLTACEEQHRAQSAGAVPMPEPLLRAQRVLSALARGGDDAPVPARIAASERSFDSAGKVRDLRPARALREMWSDRDAVLRLGIWAALDDLSRRDGALAPDGCGFDHLMAAISRQPGAVPPALQPSCRHGGAARGFAHSSAAAEFFNGRLKTTLGNLAALYDVRGADFARWLALPAYVPGLTAIEPWAQAWSVAVVATYVDWLNRAAGGSLRGALALIWRRQPKRFRPPARVLRPAAGAAPGTPKPAVLPTEDDRMHFELWLPVVLAQVLDHDPERWAAMQAGAHRFAVPLSMKTLDQADSRRRDATLADYRNVTLYRGLTIVQIYMAAAIDRLLPPPLAAHAGT
jgi:hypothetical protein